MKVIILAAGQGTRLRPLTDDRPKCMVEINGKSIIDRQLDTMKQCGIKEEDITIITGYKGEVLKEYYKGTGLHFIQNEAYETTNMVCSLMCGKCILEKNRDIIVSYGDIVYNTSVLQSILEAQEELAVVVDDGWYTYWKKRCENPLDDAETLIYDKENRLIEIGQKTLDINRIQAQYIGLMRYQGNGVQKVLDLCREAEERSREGKPLWKTERSYNKMYMTDMLQGLIEKGSILTAVHINRGWYEVDCAEDLKVAETEIL